jgi:methionine-rich copper-binding protein CopC
MPTFTGTTGNDSWTVVTGGDYTIDGLDGVDTVSFGIETREDFSITLNDDGTVSVDTVSGASQPAHLTLKNIEKLAFDNGHTVIDLATLFDKTAPTLASSSPAAGATGVAVGADIVLTFSESIRPGSGTVTLQNAAGQTVESYTIGSSPNLSVSGNHLTVNPTADLAAGGTYTLTVSGGALKDIAGNALAAAASVSFTTDAHVSVGADNAPLAGTAGNDVMAGDARDNVFIGSAGKDSIDGGAGIDKLQLAGKFAGYTINIDGTNATISDASGDTVSVANVERVQFADAMVALDIAGDGGQVYRLYQAAFARTPDSGGLGFWIGVMDKGATLASIATGFVASDEFKSKYGANPTSTDMVTAMYANVLHRAPDSAGLSYWVGALDSHQITTVDVLAFFSESPENQQNVITVIGHGFEYTPFP